MCLTYTVPTIHSNDAMHTIPIIPIIHTTYTIDMQHNCHTYHTYNSKHTCLTYHTYHTSIVFKHAIPDRPYTPYIPNIPYHTPTTPQGGRGTVPHPHHTTGGEGEDLNMGPIPCRGGEGGGWQGLVHIYVLIIYMCVCVLNPNHFSHKYGSRPSAAPALPSQHYRAGGPESVRSIVYGECVGNVMRITV